MLSLLLLCPAPSGRDLGVLVFFSPLIIHWFCFLFQVLDDPAEDNLHMGMRATFSSECFTSTSFPSFCSQPVALRAEHSTYATDVVHATFMTPVTPRASLHTTSGGGSRLTQRCAGSQRRWPLVRGLRLLVNLTHPVWCDSGHRCHGRTRLNGRNV